MQMHTAYRGYLLKIGNYTIPTSIIKADAYKAYSAMQDYEPYTDGEGYLHRNAVKLHALVVEFDTVPMLNDEQFANLMYNISENFISGEEHAKTCIIEAFIPDENKYVTQRGYMADIEPNMYFADGQKIQYDAVHFQFVGGVAAND